MDDTVILVLAETPPDGVSEALTLTDRLCEALGLGDTEGLTVTDGLDGVSLGKHVTHPLREYWPAGHAVSLATAEAVPHTNPALQLVHTDEPAGAYCPAGHGV